MPRYYIGNIPCGKTDLAHYGVPGMEWGKHKFGIDANTKYVNWYKPGKRRENDTPHLLANNAGTRNKNAGNSIAISRGNPRLKDQIKARQQRLQATRSNAPRMVEQLQQQAANQRKADAWNQKHPAQGLVPVYGDEAAARLGNDRLASQTRFMDSQRQQQMALNRQRPDAAAYLNTDGARGQIAANIAYDKVNPRGGVAGYFGGDAERANAAAANARAEQNPTERNKALANEANQALAKYESGIRPTIYNAGTAVGNAVGTAANNVGEYLSRDAVDQRYADEAARVAAYPSPNDPAYQQALADYQYAHGQYNPQYQGFNGISSIPGVIGNNARELATTVGSRIQGGLGNAYDAVTDVGGRIGTSIANTANNVGNWIGQRANDVGNWFDGVGNTIGNAARGVGDWVGGAVNNVGNWVGGVGNTIGNAARGVSDWVGNRVANVGDFVNRAGDWVGGAANRVGDFFTGNQSRASLDAAGAAYDSRPNTATQTALLNAQRGYGQTLPGWFDSIANSPAGRWIGNASNAVGSAARGVGDFFTGNQSRAAMQNIQNQINAGNPAYFGTAGVQAMQDASRGYGQTLPGMFQNILPMAGNAVNWVGNTVSNIGNGVRSGIDSAGNWIGNTAIDAANGVRGLFGYDPINFGAIATSNGQLTTEPMVPPTYYLPQSAYNLPAGAPNPATVATDLARHQNQGSPVYQLPASAYTYDSDFNENIRDLFDDQRLRHDALGVGKGYKGSCIVKDISYRG